MELRITPYKPAEAPQFNYAELKAAVEEKMTLYAAAIYSDDQIKDAKADKAALNKLRKALNDERIKREREYMQPFAEFKAQVNEIIGIIDRPVAAIDRQVKDFEERKKAEKREAIFAYWAETGAPEWLHSCKPSWLNASYSMKTIKAEIDANIQQAEKQLDVIRKLPQYAFEAEEHYKVNHSLDAAISEAYRLQELAARKAAQEAEMAKAKETMTADEASCVRMPSSFPPHDPAEPQREWVAFKVLVSPAEAKALRAFCENHGIEVKPV